MQNLCLAYKNAVDDATWYGNADGSFPLTNLSIEKYSKIWRLTPSTNGDGNFAAILCRFSRALRMRHLAICRHNLSPRAQWRIRAGLSRFDADFVSPGSISVNDLTFSGGANGTRYDEYGLLTVGSCPRKDHDRRYFQNGFKWSEDLTKPEWAIVQALKHSDGQTVSFNSAAIDVTEKVSNGTFENGTMTGWTGSATAPASVAYNNSYGRTLALITGASTNDALATTTMTLVAGRRYKLRLSAFLVSTTAGAGVPTYVMVLVGNSAGAQESLSSIVQPVSLAETTFIESEFTAAANTQVLSVYNFNDFAASIRVDCVSITEVGASLTQTFEWLPADTYEVRAQVKLVSGDPTFKLKLADCGSPQFSQSFTATANWKWFSASLTTSMDVGMGNLYPTGAHAGIQKMVAAGVLKIRKLQIRRGLSNGEYTRTTNKRRFQSIGVLIEEARQNVLQRSSEFHLSPWVKATPIVLTTGYAMAPDGTMSATLMAPQVGSGNTTGRQIYQTYTTTTAGYWTFSIHAKRSGIGDRFTWPNIAARITDGAAATHATQANMNLTMLLPQTPGVSGGSWTDAVSRIDLLGDGWLRLSVTVYVNTAITQLRGEFWLGGYSGSDESEPSMLIWGAQLEQGPVPTSYIPTTSAAVTRSTDTIQSLGASFASWYTGGPGTLYVEYDAMYSTSPSSVPGAVAISDGSSANRIAMFHSWSGGTNATLRAQVHYASTIQADFFSAALAAAPGVPQKTAITFDWGYFVAAFNGVAATQDNAGALPISPTQLDIGTSLTAKLNGHVRRVVFWPQTVSPTELASLTANGPGALDYDSGWIDAWQMNSQLEPSATWGKDFDLIESFSPRMTDRVQISFFDPDKVGAATPWEIGRIMVPEVELQPVDGVSYGMETGWRVRSNYDETSEGARKFNILPKAREVAFEAPWLTMEEGDYVHELQGLVGTDQEVLLVVDPDDRAKNQRHGFVGYLNNLDKLKWPQYATADAAFEMTKKR